MPNLFSKLKRKSNSHKSAGASSPTASPSSPTSQASPSTLPHHVTTPPPKNRPSLDLEDIPPRSTSLSRRGEVGSPRSPHRAADDADVASGMQRLTLSQAPPQLPPLPFSEPPNSSSTSALELQREALVDEIASAAKGRKEGLSDAGRAVFLAAGMGKEADTVGSLDVETRYMKPVVQETIIVKEHTETTTIIDQHIHRHHVYPTIQPISDPNPIRLEARHRIFSALDGKWHECSEADAIAILGEDVFYNGPKEHREERKAALPGLGGEVDDRAFEARVVEREGVKGEGMGTWHQIKGLAGLQVETPSKMVGEGWMLPEEELGPVQRTVGIAL